MSRSASKPIVLSAWPVWADQKETAKVTSSHQRAVAVIFTPDRFDQIVNFFALYHRWEVHLQGDRDALRIEDFVLEEGETQHSNEESVA